MSSLDVVIVNWNAGHLLAECLRSIAETNRSGYVLKSVVVVDNASTDGSIDALRGDCSEERYPVPGTRYDFEDRNAGNAALPIILVENSTNVGFAATCNQGARRSDADYVLFLNPDTRLFDDTLSTAVRFIASMPNAGPVHACGCHHGVSGRRG